MIEHPLVSVIVPAYNCVKYIPETLSSLFQQDYPNIEIVVVNDGSKDDTLDLLKSYGDKIVLVDQANTGVPGARNHGIKVARGRYVAFCDSDDLWSPQKVSEQVRYLETYPEVGMVYCDWQVWHPDDGGLFTIPESFKQPQDGQVVDPDNSGWIYHKLLLDCVCLTSSVMFRADIIAQVGYFDLNLWNGEDYDYWLRTSRITQIHKLKPTLVLYRILPQSLARTPTRIHYEYEVLNNAIARWGSIGPTGETIRAGALSHRIAEMRFGFGYLHFKTGDSLIAMKSFLGAIRQKPFWHLPWAYLIMSLWKRLAGRETCSVYLN